MFGLGRGLRRLFGGAPARLSGEGLTRGDSALLELLDFRLLLTEGRAAEVAAGRIGLRDKARRRLEAARVWREAARRSGDAAYLRKAATMAESAAAGFEAARRPDDWARARCEQAFCALTGAELFGDAGLNAAAEVAFREARARVRAGLAAALADLGLAVVAAREALASADAEQARALADRFAAPIATLEVLGRRASAARALAAEARLTRADLLCGCGARLGDQGLLKMAAEEAAAAGRRLNPSYEPLIWARAALLRGQALTLFGEHAGDVDSVAAAAAQLAGALELVTRDHSPLDWARAQLALAETLQALGEACGEAQAFERAVTCYDRANLVLRDAPAIPLRGHAAGARAACLGRLAALTGDLAVLDVAEAAMKMQLAERQARRDPAAWALAQLHLARLYEARMTLTGNDGGRRAAAVLALEAALEVFAESGLHSLAKLAADPLDRLRLATPRQPRTAV